MCGNFFFFSQLFYFCIQTVESQFNLNFQSNTKAKELLEQACNTIGIQETEYFGIQYIDKTTNNLRWLNINTYLSDHNFHKTQPIELQFKVRFFPNESKRNVILDETRKFFYYQLRDDILSTKLPASPEQIEILAGYAVSAKFGPFDRDNHGPGYLDGQRYLPRDMLDHGTVNEKSWEERVSHWHKIFSDKPHYECIEGYLENAENLDRYGISYYTVSSSDKIFYLGVNTNGLNLFHLNDRVNPMYRGEFPWSDIKNLKISGKKLVIEFNELQEKFDPTGTQQQQNEGRRKSDVSTRNTNAKSKYMTKTYIVKTGSEAQSIDILDQCSGYHAIYLYSLARDTPEKIRMRFETKRKRAEIDRLQQRNVSLLRKTIGLGAPAPKINRPDESQISERQSEIAQTLQSPSTKNLVNSLEQFGKNAENFESILNDLKHNNNRTQQFDSDQRNHIDQDTFNNMVNELKMAIKKTDKSTKQLDYSEAILAKLEELERTVLNMQPGGVYNNSFNNLNDNENQEMIDGFGNKIEQVNDENGSEVGSVYSVNQQKPLSTRDSISSDLKKKIAALKESRKYDISDQEMNDRINNIRKLALSDNYESSLGSVTMSKVTTNEKISTESSPTAKPNNLPKVNFEDLDPDNQFLISVLQNTPTFNKIPFPHLLYMAVNAEKFEADENGYITQAGQTSEEFFILDQGSCDIISADGQKCHGRLNKGDVFGVESCLKKLKRNCSVITSSNCVFWTVSNENIPIHGRQIDVEKFREMLGQMNIPVDKENKEKEVSVDANRNRNLSAITEQTENHSIPAIPLGLPYETVKPKKIESSGTGSNKSPSSSQEDHSTTLSYQNPVNVGVNNLRNQISTNNSSYINQDPNSSGRESIQYKTHKSVMYDMPPPTIKNLQKNDSNFSDVEHVNHPSVIALAQNNSDRKDDSESFENTKKGEEDQKSQSIEYKDNKNDDKVSVSTITSTTKPSVVMNNSKSNLSIPDSNFTSKSSKLSSSSSSSSTSINSSLQEHDSASNVGQSYDLPTQKVVSTYKDNSITEVNPVTKNVITTKYHYYDPQYNNHSGKSKEFLKPNDSVKGYK